MPTTRTRRARGASLDARTVAVIGYGTGINHLPDVELRQLWREHGAAVTEHWQRKYGADEETFVGWLARTEGWE